MTVLVMNCNHWIGFHLVDRLLEMEYEVNGVLNEEENDDLTLFFGRNSQFSLVSSIENIIYDTCFIIGEIKEDRKVKANQIIVVDEHHQLKATDNPNAHIVRPPLLFGEWMPITKDGYHNMDRRINIQSEQFKKDAVYIKNFVEGLLQLMHIKNLPSILHVYPRFHSNSSDPIHHSVYMRKNGNDQGKINEVMAHCDNRNGRGFSEDPM